MKIYGYGKFDTVYVDPDTGKKIPKNQLGKYNIIP